MKNTIYLVDIDGVLADYAEGFTRFVNLMMGTKYKASDMKMPGFRNNFDFPEYQYEQLKRAYRQFEFKMSLKVIPGYVEFFRKHKGEIFVWTSRAVDEFPHIRALTFEWMRKHGMGEKLFCVLDGGFPSKSDWFLEFCNTETTKFVVIDDDPDTLKKMSKYTKQLYLFDQPYNRDSKVGTRITSLKQIP